jgi:DNA polymerase IV
MTNALCRDCASVVAAGRCDACGSDRIARHDELRTLSIAHLDCDAFYAQIEKRDNPTIAAKPVIVGGGRRGVVSTCCYVARAFGVRSAMPMFKALKLCPQAVVVKPDMAKYVAVGRQVRTAMLELTPLVQPLSIDEAFMDLTGTEALHDGPPAKTLIALQNRIEATLDITVSIGLSFNKFLAKTASDLDKPRGFSVIGKAEALAFLGPRAVGTLPGVGPAGVATLERAGYRRIGDIRAAGMKAMIARFGDWGMHLYRLSVADDPRVVDPEGERKSVSAETTFFEDISDHTALEDILWSLCEKVSMRARAGETAGRTITLKLRRADFRIVTRRRTLGDPTLLAHRLFETGRALLAAEPAGVAYRLIGIGLSDLADADEADKGDLMDTETPRRAAAEAAVAKARARYGKGAVVTGRGLKTEDEKDDPKPD